MFGSFSANSNSPVTNTDSITLVEGGYDTTTTANGAALVLANDTDPDGDTFQDSKQPALMLASGFTIVSQQETPHLHPRWIRNDDRHLYL